MGNLMNRAEAILSARLPQENLSGIVDIMKILSNPNATEAEIGRALVRLENERSFSPIKYFIFDNPNSCILNFSRHIYTEHM